MLENTSSKIVRFSFEQKVIHQLLLYSRTLSDLGLLNGKMGIAIVIFHYAKYVKEKIYEDYACTLLDDIWEEINCISSLDFDSGLSGIAWGIEYLIQNKFVSGNGSEICKEIDAKIMKSDPRRLDKRFLEKELEGFMHYILIRFSGSLLNKETLPFDKLYRDDLSSTFIYLLNNNLIKENIISLINKYFNLLENSNHICYKPNIEIFIQKSKLKVNKRNIKVFPLGLTSGIAGELYKTTISE